MSRWEARIEKVDNGFVLKERDVEVGWVTKTFQEKTDNEIDRDHFIELLWEIVSYFGEEGSKHDEKRFFIGYEYKNGKILSAE